MKKKNTGCGDNILICPNPIAIAPASADCSAGLMPSGIHGSIGESIKKESSIDYPVSSGLCDEIWDFKDGAYVIKPEIKQYALELVDKLLLKYKVQASGVNVVGSICSNQYTPDADVDIHIQVKLPQGVADALNNLRKMESDQIFKDIDLMVGKSKTHPLEFYFQHNIYGDMGSCGCYDLMNDEWLSGPQLVDLEFDPYEEYAQSFDEAFEFGKMVQTALFDLHRNLMKYNAILDQASHKEIYSDDQIMSVIGRRLDLLIDDIQVGMKVIAEIKDEMVKVRRRAGLNPKNEEEAEDMRTNKEWLTANSTFKFLQRIGVLDQCWQIAEQYNRIQSGEIGIEQAIPELDSKLM